MQWSKEKEQKDKILHIELKIEQHKLHEKMWVNSGAPER